MGKIKFTQLIINIITVPLQFARRFPSELKKRYKEKRFRQRAKCGSGLNVSENANIFIEPGASIKIGDNCEIIGILSAKTGAEINIGRYTTIRADSVLGALQRIDIGNYVIISNNVHIYDNNNHPTSPHQRIELCKSGFHSEKWNWRYSECSPITIEDNVWIGERSAILKGVTIGRGSIVASNSVVTKSVPPYSIVAGNPAKIVKQLCDDTAGQ